MTKKRSPYKAEFREKLVLLSRKGRSSSGLSREFGPSPRTIINWVRQADLDEGRSVAGATSAEREELRRARREIRRLREERNILAKAAAWFARETGSITQGCSNS